VQRLLRDKLFLLALFIAPVFWWLNYYFELSAAVVRVSWTFLFVVAVLYPVLEELCFRGALQGYLLQSAWGQKHLLRLSRANCLTSVVFVIFHLYGQSIFWSLAVFAPSLLFGYMRERHHSVFPCIILHVFYNIGFFSLR